MQLCTNHYIPVNDELADEVMAVLDREGVWDGLGDGQTLEDIIYQKLMQPGANNCPECGQRVAVNEETLGRISMEMLAHI